MLRIGPGRRRRKHRPGVVGQPMGRGDMTGVALQSREKGGRGEANPKKTERTERSVPDQLAPRGELVRAITK